MKAIWLCLLYLLGISSKEKPNPLSADLSHLVKQHGTANHQSAIPLIINGHIGAAISSFSGSLGHQVIGDMDDVSVDRVVDILRSNVKQWSFVESQLMEPNVNLEMPEIFIPLRHLSTTLELLGNILFMRDENLAAVEALERACPLMELLPRHMDEGGSSSHRIVMDSQRLASACFAMLRQVYAREKLVVNSPSRGADEETGLSVLLSTDRVFFDADERFMELRSPFLQLRHASDRPALSENEEMKEEECAEDGDDGLMSALETLLRRFLSAEGALRQEVLVEVEGVVDRAIARQKKRMAHRGRRDQLDVSLGREYLAAMHQISRSGVEFVDHERSQLSLAVALSYDDGGGVRVSGTDKNRLLVLEAISEFMAGGRAARTPSEHQREEPFLHAHDSFELASTLFEPPLPLFEPLPRKTPSARIQQQHKGSVEYIFLAALSVAAILFLLFLLHSEIYRSGASSETSIFDFLNAVPRAEERQKRLPAFESKRRKDRKKRPSGDKLELSIELGAEGSESEHEVVPEPASIADLLVDAASLSVVDDQAREQADANDWIVPKADGKRRPEATSGSKAQQKDAAEAVRRRGQQVPQRRNSGSKVSAVEKVVVDKTPVADKTKRGNGLPPNGTPSNGSVAHSSPLQTQGSNGKAWTKAVHPPPESPLPLPLVLPAPSPYRSRTALETPSPPVVPRRQRGPQDDFGTALAQSLHSQGPRVGQQLLPPLPAPATREQSSTITIALMVRCANFSPSHSLSVRVAPSHLGRFEPAKALAMRRSIADSSMWVLTLRVPQFAMGAEFVYKYFVFEGVAGEVLEEAGEPRRIYLADKDTVSGVEQEDFFSAASLVMVGLQDSFAFHTGP